METNKEIYEIFKSEYITIKIPNTIKYPVLCHMRKYLEALELEYEFTGGNAVIVEDISNTKDLLLRLILSKDYEEIEMTIAEFLILAGMIYCVIPLFGMGFYGEFDSEIVDEYRKLYKSIDEVYKALDEKHIDKYKKYVKFKDDSINKHRFKM